MRIAWIVVCSVVLVAGAVNGQEPASSTYRSEIDPRTRGIFRARRPFSRWFGRSSAVAASDAIAAPEDPFQRVSLDVPPGLRDAPGNGVPADAAATGPGPGGAAAAPGEAAGAGEARSPGGGAAISSNPGAVNIIAGTGALGRFLGLDEGSGMRLGGLWIGDASGVLAGGRNPGKWGLNSLTIVDLNLDTEKLFGMTGGSFGTEFLQFSGQPTNKLAGAFPGFDSLEVTRPLVRQELYELWYRQSLFDDRLIFRVGKSVPTYDFNNVVRPVPTGDPSAAIPAVTGLLYTPVFVNPTMLGVIPGYYNSATGITTTVAPSKSLYLNYGFYDGNLALGRQTGLEGPHFNGYYFHIGEVGYSYRLGSERKPGNIGVGVWGQTGKLKTFADTIDHGANGVYLFGSQRLWFRRPGIDSSGVSGFYQLGANNSNALLARQYAGGGLTAFGLVPGRPDDTFGVGLAWTWLTPGDQAGHLFFPNAPDGPLPLSPSQLMIQAYYQMRLADGLFFQTALTEIPNPGQNEAIPSAFAVTLRVIALF